MSIIKNNLPKALLSILVAAVIVGSILAVNYYVMAWIAPDAHPPAPAGNLTITGGLWQNGAEGSEIYFDADNVGIGTDNPGAKLEIYQQGLGLYLNQAAADDIYMRYHVPGVQWWTVGPKANGDFWFSNASDLSAAGPLTLGSNGNVGIGTGNPGGYRLNVNGNQFLGGQITIDQDWATPSSISINSNQVWNSTGGNLHFQYNCEGCQTIIGDNVGAANNLTVYGGVTARDWLNVSGNVSIGDAPNNDYNRLYFNSGTNSVAGVINRGTASSDLYFGEAGDTGRYIFRGSGDLTTQGDMGANNYCDASGNNCTAAASLGKVNIIDAGGPTPAIDFSSCQWQYCYWDSDDSLTYDFGPGTCHSQTATSKWAYCPDGWRLLSGGGSCSWSNISFNGPLTTSWNGSHGDPQAWVISCATQSYYAVQALCCH